MRTTLNVLVMDLRRSWPLLALLNLSALVMMALYTIATLISNEIDLNYSRKHDLRLLLWLVLIVLVGSAIQADPPREGRGHWASRPITGLQLLAAKALFCLLGLVLIPALAHLGGLAAVGVEPRLLLVAAVDLALYAFSALAILALIAALTPNQPTYWLVTLGVFFASGLLLAVPLEAIALVSLPGARAPLFLSPPIVTGWVGAASALLLVWLYLRRESLRSPRLWWIGGAAAVPLVFFLAAPHPLWLMAPTAPGLELVGREPDHSRWLRPSVERGAYVEAPFRLDRSSPAGDNLYLIKAWNLDLETATGEKIPLRVLSDNGAMLTARLMDERPLRLEGARITGHALAEVERRRVVARLPPNAGASAGSGAARQRVEALEVEDDVLVVRVSMRRFVSGLDEDRCQQDLRLVGERPQGAYGGPLYKSYQHQWGLYDRSSLRFALLSTRADSRWQQALEELVLIERCPIGRVRIPVDARTLRWTDRMGG